MPKNNLRKQLYQLMTQSMAIQSLEAEEKLEMQDKMLGLPENEMQEMIRILRSEQNDMAELHKRAVKEQKEAKKMVSMAQSLRDAGRRLDKAFLIARESEDRDQSSQATHKLLKEIDLL